MRQHSVLTVDDEELALQGLEAGIDWDGLNISRLRKAHSRDEAVRLLEQDGDSELAALEGTENSAQIVAQVKKLISENLSEGNLQRDELAAMVHISPGYLGRIFKKETGMALTNYITKKADHRRQAAFGKDQPVRHQDIRAGGHLLFLLFHQAVQGTGGHDAPGIPFIKKFFTAALISTRPSARTACT